MQSPEPAAGGVSYTVRSPCKNKDKGCKWSSYFGKLNEHLRTQCRYENTLECEFCEAQLKTKLLDDHQNLNPEDESSWRQGCGKARLQCFNCEDTIERQQLDEHLNMEFTNESWLDGCQNVKIKCVKESCEETLERHQMKEHFESSHPSESQEGVDYGEMEQQWKEANRRRRLGDKFEEKHLGLILTIAWGARDKWRDIGEELGLKLESSMFEGDSVEVCFARMTNLWLTSDEGEKCGQVLLSALKSSKVGCQEVAESVEKCIVDDDGVIQAGKIKCILCQREVLRRQLNAHLNLDPKQPWTKWNVKCNHRRFPVAGQKRKRGMVVDDEQDDDLEGASRKVAKSN